MTIVELLGTEQLGYQGFSLTEEDTRVNIF